MTPTAAADTIAAVATAPGRGAIGVLKVSGPDTPRIAAALLGAVPPARMATLRRFQDADGSSLDEGLATYFPAPASFTGEHVLELSAHGGAFVLDRVLKRLLELGARLARPGEFTERAFLNGKLDLVQAEAVADLIDAGSAAAARAALRSLQGEFSRRIERLQAQLTELRTLVEATIDFPDEDIDVASTGALRERLTGLERAFDSISDAALQGALLRDGLTVVIAGRPNAGKSTLLNRLSGEDIAIVTPVPGTTRDVLRQQIHLDGLPVTLIDTAGLRSGADAVEAEGIRRARIEIERADHVLYVSDGSLAANDDESNDDRELPWAPPSAAAVTRIVNKIDLTGVSPHVEQSHDPVRVFLSAHTGAGVDALKDRLKTAAGYRPPGADTFCARRRQLDALDRARMGVARATASLESQHALELLAEDLRLAQRALGEITGEFSSEDLLGEIFSSFCIGK